MQYIILCVNSVWLRILGCGLGLGEGFRPCRLNAGAFQRLTIVARVPELKFSVTYANTQFELRLFEVLGRKVLSLRL